MWCNDIPNSESVGFQSLGPTGDTKMHTPKNRNSPATLLGPFAVGLQSWANAMWVADGWSNWSSPLLFGFCTKPPSYTWCTKKRKHLHPSPTWGSDDPQIPFGFVQWHLRGLRAWRLWSGQNLGIFCHVVLILPRLGPVFSCGLPPPGQNFGERGKKISGQFDTWLGMFGPHLN